jgi:hypothetical protein
VLRQGLGVTWLLAAFGAGGRVVVPITIQQAIDRGIVGHDRSGSGSSGDGSDRSHLCDPRRFRPAAGGGCASACAASAPCTTCGRG